MPSFLDDIKSICPEIWEDFCLFSGDEAQLWSLKLDGKALCLDRDWRKIVFKFFDFFLVESQNLVPKHQYPDGKRLNVIVHPVRISPHHPPQMLSHLRLLASSSTITVKCFSIRSSLTRKAEGHSKNSVSLYPRSILLRS